MAHYAFLDENNYVVSVITGIDENELIDGLSPEIWYGNFKGMKCKRTSYNAKIRKNYAGIGYFYDEVRDAFIPPKTFPSWILNEDTCNWESPVPYPDNADPYAYVWDEQSVSWVEAE